MKHVHNLVRAMTPFPYSIDADETIANAEKMLLQHEIRHLPVTEKGKLIGIVSERDIVVSLMVSKDLPKDAGEMLVSDVCIRDPYLVDVSAPLHEVARDMADQQIGSAIVTKHGKLVGIFTSVDACRCLAEFLQPSPRGDSAA